MSSPFFHTKRVDCPPASIASTVRLGVVCKVDRDLVEMPGERETLGGVNVVLWCVGSAPLACVLCLLRATVSAPSDSGTALLCASKSDCDECCPFPEDTDELLMLAHRSRSCRRRSASRIARFNSSAAELSWTRSTDEGDVERCCGWV